jgi:hypothetical protein
MKTVFFSRGPGSRGAGRRELVDFLVWCMHMQEIKHSFCLDRRASFMEGDMREYKNQQSSQPKFSNKTRKGVSQIYYLLFY